jgi:putative DNA primase/helicase
VRIPALCLTIVGGIQPGVLAQYLNAAIRGGVGDDGLVQRFQLLVYPDVARDWQLVDRWPNRDAREKAYAVFERAANLSQSAFGATAEDGELPYLRFDGSAQRLFDRWLTDLMTRLRAGGEHPAVEAHLMKYTKLMPALALIFHIADSGQGAVSLVSAQRAAALCELLEFHLRRVYACVRVEKVRAAQALLAKLKVGKLPSPFTARDVYKSGWAGLIEREMVEDALAILVDHAWLRDITVEQPGRPRREYHAHPVLGFLGVPKPRNAQEDNAPRAAQKKGT